MRLDRADGTGDRQQDRRKTNELTSSAHRLIDFEYAGFNPRALDIANTWLEHCDMNNLKPNYEKEFPSLEQQRFYLTRYCKAR